jgi:murein DD-endopeptidase MepM/ murein hydrolase activator NlpD
MLCLLIGVTSRHSISSQSSLLAESSPAIPAPSPNKQASAISNNASNSTKPLSQPTKEATLHEPAENLGMTISKLSKENEAVKPETIKPTWRTLKVQKGDTLAKIFKRNGYPKQDLTAILSINASARKHLTLLDPRKPIKVLLGEAKKVHGLSLDTSPGNTLTLSRKEHSLKKQVSFLVEQIEAPLKKQLAFGKGQIKSGSLFSAGKNAGLDRAIITQMVSIFGSNLNLTSKLKPNDSFRVLFEEKRLDGERIGAGTILAAEIVNGGKKHMAIRYTDKSGRTGYFSPEGNGMHQAFLSTPVNFTRISSAFGARAHPVYHKMREHKGVDYCAPAGTPVMATADAKVIFAGNRGGYGKVIELQHGARYSTLYAHLSRFEKKISVGTEIKQGQIIGYVGRTGLATGDHLHYEFRIDGIHRDPLSTMLPRRNPIPDSNKHHFLAHAKEMIRLMDLHEHKISMARNEYSQDE